MDIQRFFSHWNLAENPFQAEEARNDAVYCRIMERAVTHPDFHKIYGHPTSPSTAIVFGEKGSGKTAMRLMMEQRLQDHNDSNTEGKVFFVRYDDLNPLLDCLTRRLGTTEPMKVLESFRLAEHQDAILSLATTQLLDLILTADKDEGTKARQKKLKQMGRQKRLDLATLAILYDHPRQAQTVGRWKQLKKLLKIGSFWNRKIHGLTTLALGIAGVIGAAVWRFVEEPELYWQAITVVGVAGFLGLGVWWCVSATKNFLRARQIQKEIRVVPHATRQVSRQIWDLPDSAVALQPFPKKGDQDARYELTHRFIEIVGEIGYHSLIVLMDRVDEPVMINSDSDRMKALIWPMFYNKFLQQEHFGVKMLLPIELGQRLSGESSEFKRQARLDKQNVVNPLRWTGATLYDLCSARFRSCQKTEGRRIQYLKELFTEEVTDEDLIEALDQMHQPRDAFKLVYAVILQHCQNTPGDTGEYRIPKSTLDQVRRDQSQRVVDLYRGVAAS